MNLERLYPMPFSCHRLSFAFAVLGLMVERRSTSNPPGYSSVLVDMSISVRFHSRGQSMTRYLV